MLIAVVVGCSSEGPNNYAASASITAKAHVADELGVDRDALRASVPEFDGRCVGSVVTEPDGTRHVVFMHWEDQHQFRVTDSGEDLEVDWLTEGNPGCHYP